MTSSRPPQPFRGRARRCSGAAPASARATEIGDALTCGEGAAGACVLPRLVAGLAALGIRLEAHQLRLLADYRDLLLAWNRRVNLTAITDPREVEVRHLLDALVALPVIPPQARSLVDIGSGGGVPGVPLAIARPELRVTLLEATRKKAEFLALVSASLALSTMRVIWARAERLGQEPAHREQYDVATARGVAEAAALVEYTLPLVRVGGRGVLWKGGNVGPELERAAVAIAALGGGRPEVRRVCAPGLERDRCLVIVAKQRPTPGEYPRAPGRPAKRPL